MHDPLSKQEIKCLGVPCRCILFYTVLLFSEDSGDLSKTRKKIYLEVELADCLFEKYIGFET